MLKRLAEASFRRRRRVVLFWILGIVVLGSVMGAVGTDTGRTSRFPMWKADRGSTSSTTDSAGWALVRSGASCSRPTSGSTIQRIPRWLDRILPRVHIEAPPDLDTELAQLATDEAAAAGRR
jgi:hypothetical protein